MPSYVFRPLPVGYTATVYPLTGSVRGASAGTGTVDATGTLTITLAVGNYEAEVVKGQYNPVAGGELASGADPEDVLTRSEAGSTYVSTLGVSNGTADSTAIQAALTAARIAGGGLIKGLPGQTYVLDAKLYIGSGTTLDLAGCGLQRGASLVGNMLVNYSSQFSRAVYDAGITSGASTLTSATAAFVAGDVGKRFTLTGAAASGGSVAGTITAYTNATTVTVSVTAGSTVVNGTLCVYTSRDTNISVIGPAKMVCGANASAPTPGDLHHTRWLHVDGLRITGLTWSTSGVGKFCVEAGDVTNYHVDDHVFNGVSSDGVHISGPAAFGSVSNIFGSTGDDFVAVTPCDAATYAPPCGGDVTDLNVSRLFPSATGTSGAAFVVYEAVGCITRRIDIDGLYGAVNGAGVVVGGLLVTNPAVVGLVDEITISRVHTIPGVGYAEVSIGTKSGGRIRVRDFTYNRTAASSQGIVWIQTAAVVAALSLTDLAVTAISATTVGVRVDGTVTDLNLRGLTGAALAAALIFLANTTSVVTRLTVSDIHASCFNIVQSYQVGSTLPVVALSNVQMGAGLSALADLATTTTVHLTNVSTASGNIIAHRATAVVRLHANNCKLNGGIAVIGGAGSVASASFGLSCDMSQLTTKTKGDMVNNTNAGLTPVSGTAAGLVGPCVYDGTVWKNLASGSTF